MTGILAAVVLELVRESLTGTHCRYRSPDITTNRYTRIVEDNVAYDYDGTTLVRRIPLWYSEKDGAPFIPSVGDGSGWVVAADARPTRPDPSLALGITLARVFDPNPVVTTNDPSLRDRDDAATAVPASAYRHVEIGASPYVTIVDLQAPFIPPSEIGDFDREHDGFEDVNAVFHIDRTQRYLQSLGYAGSKQIAPYAVETDTHAAGGTDNSFFFPSSTQPGRGTLFFGTGGTDDAEDADLIVHEYAHAIHEWIAPGTFLGTVASQSRAIGEGFGDYWAFSNHYAQRVASGRDPYCFADWDARCAGDSAGEQCGYAEGADCLRRLDSGRTMAEYDRGDSGGTEHRNSAIWSGGLIALFHAIGKRPTDILVIESLFGAPSNPTFATMAARMVNVDRQLFGGSHVAAICAAMSARGIVTGAGCGYTPRGELTMFPGADRALAIPENNTEGVRSAIAIGDARAIERVLVRVDITHPSRGDLRITLTAPDGTRVILQQVSFDRTRDLHVTYGLDAESFESLDAFHGRSANGTWTLNVADMRALDAGVLDSWSLAIQFAGDVPLSERPRVSTRAQVLPVVAHAPGADGAFFRTDVHLFSQTTRTATLIFTPSGEDGRASFSVAKVEVPAMQVVALRDVLPSLFARTGTGNLVVDGDVRVSARMHGGGGAGHAIEPLSGISGTTIVPVVPPYGRVNGGITEVEGREAVVDVRVNGATIMTRRIPPYSHVQFAMPPASWIELASRTAIAAYVSVVDPVSNDALYLSAGTSGADVAPAIRATGANGVAWQTDVAARAVSFIDTAGRQQTQLTPLFTRDVLGSLFEPTTGLGVVRGTGEVILRANERTISRVPRSGTGTIFPIEVSPRFRTNITLIGDTPAVARVTIFDAAGRVLETFERGIVRHQLIQIPLTIPVVDGRAVVTGEGIHAWASVVDNVSADSTIRGAN